MVGECLWHSVANDSPLISRRCTEVVSIVVAYVIGSTGLIVNVVPFGTDQMVGASSEEISSFIHWFVWAMYTGRGSGYFIVNSLQCTGMGSDQPSLVSMLFAVVVSSVALCLDILCWNWLLIEPVSQNLLKSVLSVLKYAATHKHPARRSALTYWEEDIPSRIDLGKSKYGGPFTTEQVELRCEDFLSASCSECSHQFLCLSTFPV